MIYQISRDEETSSSCSECKREHQGIDSCNHIHPSDSSSEDSPAQQPRHKPAFQSLSPVPHRDQTLTLVTLLQEEVRQLKINNEGKDKMIRELRKELKTTRNMPVQLDIRPHTYKEYAMTSKQIPRVRPEGQVPSKRDKIGRMFSPQVKPKLYQESNFHIVLLENQVKQLQLKMMQLSNKLKEYQAECDWMQKFIVSFIHMAEDLSLRYGGGLHCKGQTLRKRTKASWKYVKELINYLIK